MKRSIVWALVFLLMPVSSHAELKGSTSFESFSDSMDANGRPCSLQAIASTHELPKREADLSRKTGTLILTARIAPDGTVAYLRVLRSSYIGALDNLTTGWIKDTWRWKPFEASCKSSDINITVSWKPADPGVIAPQKECVVQSVMSTHTLAPRSPATRTLSGPVFMELTIGIDGKASALTVLQSSGSQELDALAMAWIENTWRWEVRPESCEPFRSRISMRW